MQTAILLSTLAATVAWGPTVHDQIGVNIHFTGAPARDVALLAESGFGYVRMDLAWEAVERRKGVYDFTAYDRLVGAMAARRIRLLLILDYSNHLYEQARSVRTPAGRQAFARFAAAAARRYRGQGVRWEIWNEPNLKQFWSPQPFEVDYLKLVQAASAAIREADPDAKIFAPACSRFPWKPLDTLLDHGLLACVDAVSVHPYRRDPPETAWTDYARLRRMIDRRTPAGQTPVRIVSGEWGYSNWHAGQSLSPETQAAYLARQFLGNMAHGIALSIWYDWADDGTDPHNSEHRFGTVTIDRQPKPAFLAARTLARVLGSTRFVRVVPAPERAHVLVFAVAPDHPSSRPQPTSNAGANGSAGPRTIVATWTENERATIRLRAVGLTGTVVRTKLTGEVGPVAAEMGRLPLQLSPAPDYYALPISTRPATLTAEATDRQ